jgi:hypothetical protein
VFENRVLRRIFGSKRDEVTGDWRKLHNEELHNLYFSSNITIINSCSTYWEMRNTYMILVGTPERKRLYGRPRSRCKDNIKMNLREIGCEGVDWYHLARDRNQWQLL